MLRLGKKRNIVLRGKAEAPTRIVSIAVINNLTLSFLDFLLLLQYYAFKKVYSLLHISCLMTRKSGLWEGSSFPGGMSILKSSVRSRPECLCPYVLHGETQRGASY